MTVRGPIAVTGANGRLGRAVCDAFAARGADVRAWSRPDYDLDDPAAAVRLMARDRPALVVHAAAWTDVDGCTLDPAAADRRNGDAVGALAVACLGAGADLVHVSTNEVFDGARSDGRGYRETDAPAPLNAYGVSKLLGERLAREAWAGGVSVAADTEGARLWIVRTSWLFGPPGRDFPAKILAARARIPADEELPVVADEVGCPTFAPDLARGIVRLVAAAPGGTYHLVNRGRATRFEWAAEALRACGRPLRMRAIRQADFPRPSQPPRWGVLETSAADAAGIRLRAWRAAFGAYAPSLCED